MEIVGWITIIILCALALTFIVLELGPIIHGEISSWSLRRQRNLEAKEEKANFKKTIKALNYKTKTLEAMRKNNLIDDEEFSYMNSIAILPENIDAKSITDFTNNALNEKEINVKSSMKKTRVRKTKKDEKTI